MNRVLRILFGSSGEVLIGDWRKLQNEQLHTSDFSKH